MQDNKMVVNDSFSVSKSLYLVIKRIFDICFSLLALVLLSPVFIIAIIAIKADTEGPAIFTQKRIGLNGKLFKLYKFRSMVINADEELKKLLENDPLAALEYKVNKKLKKDPRITKIGLILRKTSIDELPQLLNVLKGDMSLIGNRPYLPREIDDMGPYYEEIVKTKPGITGYWQTSGRSKTTFKVRCKLEAEYSTSMSLLLDIKIFFKTFITLFKGM